MKQQVHLLFSKKVLVLWLRLKSWPFLWSEDTFFKSLHYSFDTGTRGHSILLFYIYVSLTLKLEETQMGGRVNDQAGLPGTLELSRKRAFQCQNREVPGKLGRVGHQPQLPGADSPSSKALSMRNQVDFTTITRDLGHLRLWGCQPPGKQGPSRKESGLEIRWDQV